MTADTGLLISNPAKGDTPLMHQIEAERLEMEALSAPCDDRSTDRMRREAEKHREVARRQRHVEAVLEIVRRGG